jgi:uncharacterized protein YprB with RNaseH-like and TPR domain
MTEYDPVFFDIETTGFNPMAQQWHNSYQYDARVTAVGVGTVKGWREAEGHEDCEYDVDVYWDESEYRLLQVLPDRLDNKIAMIRGEGYEPFLVSFNGRQFDHPYLGARFSRLRLDGGAFTHGLKRLDMMRALGKRWGDIGRYPSEDDCLEEMGIASDDPYDGSDMPDMFGNGNWDAISEHARHDIEEMMRLFVETRTECMGEFYDHYDVDSEPNFVPTYDPD